MVWIAASRIRVEHTNAGTKITLRMRLFNGPAPLHDNGPFIYLLAQWWSLATQDRTAAIIGCEQVLTSLQIT